MGQQWDQGRNQKITWNKWKWGHNNPKTDGHRESSPKREIHSNTGLPQETRKSSNKQSNFTLKETWKRTMYKAQSEGEKWNNKVQSGKKQKKSLKNDMKD